MDEFLQECWPESYGFTIYGNGPSFVVSVQANSIAHEADIRAGDQLVEFDSHDVSRMSSDAIKILAKSSSSVSPSLSIVSRLQHVK